MDELANAQERLGRALTLARVGEDPELRRKVREEGEQFVRLLTGLLRMTRVHDLENQAFDQPSKDLASVIERLLATLGAVNLVVVEDQFYINEIRVREDARVESGRGLDMELKRHNVGGLTFAKPILESEVRTLISAFAARPDPKAPRTALAAALGNAGFHGLELVGIHRYRTTEDQHGGSVAGADFVERANGAVEDFWDAVALDRLQNALPCRRVVTELLDAGVDNLLEEPEGAAPHAAHALRVCQLCLVVGKALGFSEAELQDLGLTAMFHDVGYAAREGASPARKGELAHDGFAPPFERHPAAGARLLLKQKGFSEAKVRRALAILEHHRDTNDTRGKPSLFARILRIVEDYDNLIRAGKVEGAPRPGMSPAEALARMARHAGQRYDAAIFQILVNHLGRFPPGTRLLLTDGRMVRVIGGVRSPETFDKPRTAVIRDESGRRPLETIIVDLAEEGQVARVVR